ncbi:MAG: type II toxin-antitoxin system RelE/ParE family toxin [Nanoarchaeota archaeon]|nr:type II toxin-antitoxin system RelE/ParE family toxin [Nanoarchaeota archaeon]
MYSIIFSPLAEKQLKKLDKELQRRILDVLDRIRIRPHHFVKRLVGSPYFRLRVGNYRIILDIQNDKLVIVVVELGHRKKIYK